MPSNSSCMLMWERLSRAPFRVPNTPSILPLPVTTYTLDTWHQLYGILLVILVKTNPPAPLVITPSEWPTTDHRSLGLGILKTIIGPDIIVLGLTLCPEFIPPHDYSTTFPYILSINLV